MFAFFFFYFPISVFSERKKKKSFLKRNGKTKNFFLLLTFPSRSQMLLLITMFMPSLTTADPIPTSTPTPLTATSGITGSTKWDIFVIYILFCIIFIATCCVSLFIMFWCCPAKDPHRLPGGGHTGVYIGGSPTVTRSVFRKSTSSVKKIVDLSPRLPWGAFLCLNCVLVQKEFRLDYLVIFKIFSGILKAFVAMQNSQIKSYSGIYYYK